MIQMNTLDELLTKIKEAPLALIYLSQPACSVCLAEKHESLILIGWRLLLIAIGLP